MADTPEKPAVTEHTQAYLPDGMVPAVKKSVTWEALKGGVNQGITTGIVAGFWNVMYQSPSPEIKGVFRRIFLSPEREEFIFKNKSFNKWLLTGLGIGFAGGAITSTLGALHYNAELEKASARWTERENALKADSPGTGQSK